MTSAGSRLGSYALVLVGLFGSAYALGERLPGHEHSDGSSAAEGDGHEHGSTTMPTTSAVAAEALALTATSADGHRLVVDDSTATSLTFHLERGGLPVVDFTEQHGAMLHLLIIRRDLDGFQHLHPEMAADGTWTASDVQLATGGAWRMVVDVLPTAGSPLTLGADVLVPGEADVTALPAPADVVELDGLTIRRDALDFTVTPTDDLAPYLGQSAHLVAFRAGDLAYVHLHPTNDVLGDYRFAGELPGAGTYRLFLQFTHHGGVVTVPFTVPVTGSAP